MSSFLLTSRILLACVFGAAGVAKLLDAAGSRQALTDFGVSKSLAAPLGVMLPLLELTVAVAFLPAATTPYAGIGALALLAAFIVGIAANLAKGKRPNCHCFGQFHSAPVGGPVLVRNGLLGCAAAFLLIAGWSDPGPSLVAWVVPLTSIQKAAVAGGTVGLALVTAQSVLLLRILRLQSDVLSRMPLEAQPQIAAQSAVPQTRRTSGATMAVGSEAPGFALESSGGGVVSLDMLLGRGKPVLLVFSDPACGSCAAMLPRLSQWEREHADSLTIALLSRKITEKDRAAGDHHGLSNVLLQRESEVATAYRVFGTPSAVLVLPDRTIGSPLAAGETEIGQLVTRTAQPATQPALFERAPAPDFSLVDLDGTPVTLSQFRGKTTLVLFWNPGCGYCQGMLKDLQVWEAMPAEERSQLLIVSAGSPEDNRTQDLRSPTVLDAGFTVGTQFGATGTPSAVLVSADGLLASELVTGAPAVLALAGQPPPAEAAAASAGSCRPPASTTTLPIAAKPIKHDCVHDELLSDSSMVLYNGCQNQVMTLNPTGALVWESCDGDHDVDAIVAEIRDVFPESAEVDRDVRELLDRLLQADMISPNAPAAAQTEAVSEPVNA